MNIITKKVTLKPAPFVGTTIRVVIDDTASLTWGMYNLDLAEGRERAVIDWGDGTQTELTESGEAIHAYAATGAYEVRISDDIETIQCSVFGSSSDYRRIYAPMIREFRSTSVNLTKIDSLCFCGATNLQTFACDGSGVVVLGSRAFAACTSLVGRLDLPGVKELSANTFMDALGITELQFSKANEATITALPAWDASNHNFGATNAVCKFDL